ncbi:hypothetical protein [Bradyrhizobium sp. STM 3809]|uniref:hypothetical protein n=1 Tax=Bradyrhizobium sp. STM 3809 TaxID=551936 RepID=UPI000240A31B|nr:hypothetical protein [Bradyrhizobium sp. STM 3809]CCE03410.1 hypothetical protein BRAS3809_7410002 [Bradyrhizobium sp. STM 3809]
MSELIVLPVRNPLLGACRQIDNLLINESKRDPRFIELKLTYWRQSVSQITGRMQNDRALADRLAKQCQLILDAIDICEKELAKIYEAFGVETLNERADHVSR